MDSAQSWEIFTSDPSNQWEGEDEAAAFLLTEAQKKLLEDFFDKMK